MPKSFGSGGGATPQYQANSSSGQRMTDFFPEQGSAAQYDMIMQLVQAGMSNASASGSPLASLLAPIAGAAISGRATRKRDDAKSKEQDSMTSSVLGDVADDPKVQGYLDVLNNPDTPPYLKSIAQKKLDSTINPRAPTRGARPQGNTSQGAKANRRLYGNYEINGVMHGRDNYGNMVPYTDPQGQPVRSSSTSSGAANSSTPASIVDELASLTSPVKAQSAKAEQDTRDPLGILNLSQPQSAAQPVQPPAGALDPLGILNLPPA